MFSVSLTYCIEVHKYQSFFEKLLNRPLYVLSVSVESASPDGEIKQTRAMQQHTACGIGHSIDFLTKKR